MDATVKTLNLSKFWQYDGKLAKHKQRYGFGKEIWKNDENQKYSGYFHLNCLHGKGEYNWGFNKYYEGSFYANDKHGYGCLSYSDGSYFEGLFKNNQRFGPGIYTYPDGTQDVGLWMENQLIRLSTNLTENIVPTLTKSPDAKIFLNKYKKLIVISNQKTPSRIILEQINAADLRRFENYLYNNLVKNASSLFFNQSEFDKDTLKDVSKLSVSSDPYLDQTIEILAWNNEEHLISLMEYIYKNRSSEKELTFKVLELLNERELFGIKGKFEVACENFFQSVTKKDNSIRKYIFDFDINPDLCDLNGNTAVHVAVSTDNLQDLRTLVDFGANLDHFNDECLTPLLICFLRYLQVKENIQYWETAFLPPIFQTEETDNPYILDLSCKVINFPEKKKKEKKSKEKPVKDKPAKEKKRKDSNPQPDPLEAEKLLQAQKETLAQKLKPIQNTLEALLNYGADPNLGEVPLPPFLLSLFTLDEKIVSGLISKGANPNLPNSNEDGLLTPLHIVASMKVSPELLRLAEVLLENEVVRDPRANENHWEEEKVLLDPDEQFFDEGKTPLHILAMRYDFLEDEADILGMVFDKMVRAGCNPDLYYLGHTCLSLAVLRGNLRLIERILRYGKDPNGFLGCDLGVPLTVLILKKYKNVLPLYICEEVFDLLVRFGANPFCPALEDREMNCIEFCAEENKPEGVGKKANVSKKDPHMKVIQVLNRVAQNVLDRQIMASAFRNIYNYKIICDFIHPIFNQQVRFLAVPESKKLLQKFVDHDLIQINSDEIKSLLTFVEFGSNIAEKNSTRSKKTPRSGTSGAKVKNEKPVEDRESFINNLQPNPIISKKKILDPELDENLERYHVCYNCFKREGKTLILCPNCELVYFCSQDCNKSNLKKKTRHSCNLLYYLDEFKMIQEGIFRPLILDELEKRKNFMFGTFFGGLNQFAPLDSIGKKIGKKIDSKRNLIKTKHASFIFDSKKKEPKKPKTV